MKWVEFDVASVAIYIILLVGAFLRGGKNNKKERYYMLVVLVSFFAAVFDVGCEHMDNRLWHDSLPLRTFIHSGYLMLHTMTIPAYILYLIAQADRIFKIKKRAVLFTACCLPMVLIAVLLLINANTGCMFYYDDEYNYLRGPVFITMYAVAAFYMVLGFILLLHYRKLYTRACFFSFLALYPLTIAAVAIQYFYYWVVIELFAIAIGFILISFTAQKTEERIDMDTKLQNTGAYSSDMRKSFINRKKFHVILLTLTNFHNLEDILSYEMIGKLAVTIHQESKNIARGILDFEFYHLGLGNFALTVEEKYFDRSASFADDLRVALNGEMTFDESDIMLETNVCQIRCPEDISDFESLMVFTRQFTRQEIHEEKTMRMTRNSEEGDNRSNDFEVSINIDRILKDALAANKIEVFFQPLVSVADQKPHALEAFVRLQDDENWEIDSDRVIECAERNGMIGEVGNFIIDEVCHFIAGDKFRQFGLEYVSVNISPIQSIHKNFAMYILDKLNEYRLKAENLRLEIHQSKAYMEQDNFLDNVEILRAAGVAIIVDSYGHSSLKASNLIQLTGGMVKLDKELVAAAGDPTVRPFIAGTIDMYHHMGREVVAAGVDNDEIRRAVSELGVDYIQGIASGEPLPAEQLEL